MNISGLLGCTLIDFPEHTASIIFTQGCNFNCFYCHNYKLIPRTKGTLSEDKVLQDIKDNKLITGVVISGGEPTIQKDLVEFCHKIKDIKKESLKIKLDTNGSRPDVIAHLIDNNLIDYIAMDIKAPFEKYNLITRVDNIDTAIIQDSINIIKKRKIPCMFRTTVVKPPLTREDIICIRETMVGSTCIYKQQKYVPVKKEI